jgi:hypothetical protein
MTGLRFPSDGFSPSDGYFSAQHSSICLFFNKNLTSRPPPFYKARIPSAQVFNCTPPGFFMKNYSILLLLGLCSLYAQGQTVPQKAEYLILITLDGMRWQEVFGGMDSAIANDKRFNQDEREDLQRRYWAPTAQERRKKLLPFFWSTLEAQGRLYGNRLLGSQVDNRNPYWFSYPGYSEILCGIADTAINSNDYPPNPHTNVLEFLNQQKALKGKVAAFGAWDAFDRILNEKRAGFPVVCGRDHCGGQHPSAREQLLNDMKRDAYSPFGEGEQLDVFTHYAALEYLKTKRPRVLYVAYGETDEWAHHAHYKDYLDAARQTDAWIAELWNWVQADPQYKNKTALLITTDHGRGDAIKSEWTSHGQKIKDAHEIWVAAMGPGLSPGGEMRQTAPLFQEQVAATVADWLGYTFKASHPVAERLWKR